MSVLGVTISRRYSARIRYPSAGVRRVLVLARAPPGYFLNCPNPRHPVVRVRSAATNDAPILTNSALVAGVVIGTRPALPRQTRLLV